MRMEVFDFLGLSVLIKVYVFLATASPCVFKVDFLRNYCSSLLYICTDERMKAPLSENERKFKNIQKMRE